MALPAYRHLLRAIRTAFQDDHALQRAARASTRRAFAASRALAPDSPEARSGVAHAQEVARVLRENVVQGQRAGDVYRLRIHPGIERGDNDTVKNPNTSATAPRVKCCSER
ncbi:hypothetical protein EV426DRAFT_699886 [Tirmania nivea]|nr:hypothetical protein EV426DRAFT_699886 [Tirmania nivea]